MIAPFGAARRCPRGGMSAFGAAVRRSSQRSHQVDEAEDADPDDVQEMPEHRQADQPAPVGGDQSQAVHLQHQHHQPDDAERDVQPVRAHQREERRQEGAALRPGALLDQVDEFVEFDGQEAGAEQPGDGQPGEHACLVALQHRDHRQAEGDRREQQQRGVRRHQRQLEQLRTGGAGGVAAAEHAVRREQHREDEAVAHQVQPETEQRSLLRVVFAAVVEDNRRCGSGAQCVGRGLHREGGLVVGRQCCGVQPRAGSASSARVRASSARVTSCAGM
mmetsp:Transcript_33954/g.61689  ORF Transcript_33954/g.61689 Transcript_33954/m.61689 type:complete len:276 (+) Transcript_33954:659-1486(+)